MAGLNSIRQHTNKAAAKSDTIYPKRWVRSTTIFAIHLFLTDCLCLCAACHKLINAQKQRRNEVKNE